MDLGIKGRTWNEFTYLRRGALSEMWPFLLSFTLSNKLHEQS